jgi:spermidine/putrescine transport system permease protein
MIYVYLPFMLFPMVLGLSMVPRDLLDAARDMGASRMQIWREVELPLAMPGILIGMLLTFVLAVGAVAESKVLGGQSVIVITQDIEIAFTYSQNWPFGSALAVILTLIVGLLTFLGIGRLDVDRILGRRT